MTTWCAVMDAEQSLTLSKKLAVQVESKITGYFARAPSDRRLNAFVSKLTCDSPQDLLEEGEKD